MNKAFWNKKSVLVTGFEGFLGSNLTKGLLQSDALVFGLDIKVRRKETILNKKDYRRISVIKGSVTDFKLVKEIISRHRINVVFHLAAEAIVERSHTDPLKSFSTNIEGTWKVLEACRSGKSLEAVIIASSDKSYGSHEKLPYTEETPLIGRHPYDVSKSCADLIACSYAHTFGLPVAITRCGNIYGPGDFNFSRIVPYTIRCALSGKTVFIRSDGKFTRDYVYVDDIIRGYITLAEKLRKLNLTGEAFNFSGENPITVIGLVNKIFKILGRKAGYKILNKAKYEIKNQYLSSGKARRVLGWRAETTLEDGLRKTIDERYIK